jgi:hypothetical protein
MSSKSLEDKVVPDNVQVQTSVVNGTTVYIYGENNDAAWVNNGMQYTIKDAASLKLRPNPQNRQQLPLKNLPNSLARHFLFTLQ